MYDELRLYCKSEGLTEYLISEMKIVSQKKDTGHIKVKDILLTEKKNPGSMKRTC